MSPMLGVTPREYRRCYEPQSPCRDCNCRSAPTWNAGKPLSHVSQGPIRDRAPTASPPHRVAPDRRVGSTLSWNSSATGDRSVPRAGSLCAFVVDRSTSIVAAPPCLLSGEASPNAKPIDAIPPPVAPLPPVAFRRQAVALRCAGAAPALSISVRSSSLPDPQRTISCR